MTMYKMRFKKFTIIFISIVIFLAPLFSHAGRIGWITDIHAGSAKKKKKSATNVFYPRYYKQYLSQVLVELQNEGIGLLIISGDITEHSRQTKYVKRIRAMLKERGMEMVLARGNHDREKTITKYMKQKKSYYYLDRYGWRIAVIDNYQRRDVKKGGMNASQKEWLEDLLEETKKPVLAVMHVPIFERENGVVYKRYQDMEDWFSSDGKVKLALSGHWHAEYITEYHGVKYAVGNPLTLESKLGSYYIIDLDTLWIDARQANVSERLKKKTRSGRI